MKLLMFAASLRKDSFNKHLIRLAARAATELQCTIDLAEFSEFDLPLYNFDMQTTQGIPENVTKFIKRMHDADGLVISSPEYNFSTPGTLKNFIDWVSRVTPMPWGKQQICLMSASPSMVGGNRGLWATRVPLESCGAFVFPNMFSLAGAGQAFDEHGEFKDPAMMERLQQNIAEFIKVL